MKAFVVIVFTLALCGDVLGAPKIRPKPKCPVRFTNIRLGKTSRRFKLPMCAAASPPTSGGAQAVTATTSGGARVAAAAIAAAYPCSVGDATCFCVWKGQIGYFADNDPSVGCRSGTQGYQGGRRSHPGQVLTPAPSPPNVSGPSTGATLQTRERTTAARPASCSTRGSACATIRPTQVRDGRLRCICSQVARPEA